MGEISLEELESLAQSTEKLKAEPRKWFWARRESDATEISNSESSLCAKKEKRNFLSRLLRRNFGERNIGTPDVKSMPAENKVDNNSRDSLESATNSGPRRQGIYIPAELRNLSPDQKPWELPIETVFSHQVHFINNRKLHLM